MIRSYLRRFVTGISLAVVAVTASATTATAGDWKIAGPFGGTATSVSVDPSDSKVVLAGAMGSLLYRSSDAGANWEIIDFPKRHLSELTSILIDPADSKHYLVGVIAAEGGGLFETHDAGKQWAVVKEISSYGVRALAYAPSQHERFVAGTAHGVMMSDDCGKTWTRISDPKNLEMASITAVAFDAQDPNILYVGTSHLPWKTLDAGKNWSSIHNGMIDDSDVFSIYVDPANPINVLASACSGIYASADRGDLWHKLMGIPNTSRRTHVIREDPSNPSVIYAGTTTGLYKSYNRGGTWKTLTNTQANYMAFDPANPQTLYMALQYEGIGKSENGGEHITPVNHGFVDRVISAVSNFGNKIVAIETQEGESTGVFVSSDRGESWSQMPATRGLSGVHLKAITGVSDNDRILLGASPHQIYKSIDGGAIWKSVPIRLLSNPPPVEEAPTKPAVKPKQPAAARSGTTARARTAVKPKPKVIIREVSVSDVSGLYAVKVENKDVFFAATDLGLLKSTDAAEHWTLTDIPGANAVTGLYLPAGASAEAMVARSANGLFISKDGGDHWTKLSFPLPASDINEVAIAAGDASSLLIATRLGLYLSSDGGEKWSNKIKGLAASTVSSVIFSGSSKNAFAVEYGRLYQSSDAGSSWSEVSSDLPLTRIRQLWKSDSNSDRLYALAGDLGIIYRD
jgi:photosystem II stability/assembly factor-like uncharacterized protein